jgi:mannose-6-phosphate isomerase-like protein (cupin superfamily)
MKTIIYEEKVETRRLPGRDLKWLFTPEMGLSEAFSMNVVVIQPGATVSPAHSHPEKEEVVYITSGEGQAYIDGGVYDIYAGTAVLFPKRSVHMLRNTGSEEMKVVCFFAPQATLADYEYHEDARFPGDE